MSNPPLFGPSSASAYLTQVVARDAKLRRRVSTLYSEFCQGLNAITLVQPAYLRRRLFRLWFDDHDAKAQAFPGEVGSFTRNVLRAAYRDVMKGEINRVRPAR